MNALWNSQQIKLVSGFLVSLEAVNLIFEDALVLAFQSNCWRKKAVAYFADKFDDPMMYAQLENCVKVPTETIFQYRFEKPFDKR